MENIFFISIKFFRMVFFPAKISWSNFIWPKTIFAEYYFAEIRCVFGQLLMEQPV